MRWGSRGVVAQPAARPHPRRDDGLDGIPVLQIPQAPLSFVCCRKHGIAGRSRMRKPELVAALEARLQLE